MATRMLQRRGTAAEWASQNPVLAAGEIGYETDTKVQKVGDGVTAWNSLTMSWVPVGGGVLLTNPISHPAPTQDAHTARKVDVDAVATDLANTGLNDLADLSDTARTAALKSVEVDDGATPTASALPSTYPDGISTSLAGTGFPATSGFVTTYKHSNSRIVQTFTAVSSTLTNDVRTYVRYGYIGGATDGWGPWTEMGGNRTACGRVSVTHSNAQNGSATPTFPSGRFDPSGGTIAVSCTVYSGTGSTVGMTLRVSGVTSTGFNLYTRAASVITETFNVDWVAMQEPV